MVSRKLQVFEGLQRSLAGRIEKENVGEELHTDVPSLGEDNAETEE